MHQYEPKKGAIFDLDGTLLDTLGDLYDSVNYTLRHFGQPERQFKEIKSFVGSGIRALLKRALSVDVTPDAFEQYMLFFQEYYANNIMNKTSPYPGIIKMLKELKSMDVALAIVSNKFQEGTDALRLHFFSDLIGFGIGKQKDIMPKPAPDSLYLAVHELGLDTNRDKLVFIGDSDVDIITARAADIPIIAVTWGFRSEEELSALDPGFIANKPEDIIRIIKEL